MSQNVEIIDEITYDIDDALSQKIIKRDKLLRMFMLFIITAFLGWVVETLYGLTCVGITDRGFLILPVCPIYGFAFLIVYYILKPPYTSYWKEIYRYLLKNIQNSKVKKQFAKVGVYFTYFLASVVVTTVIELIIGFIMDKVFSIRLWDYRDYKYNLNGYITVEFSFYWGLMSTLFMTSIYPLINLFVDEIPTKKLYTICSILIVLLALDISICFGYLFITGKNLVLFKNILLKRWIHF